MTDPDFGAGVDAALAEVAAIAAEFPLLDVPGARMAYRAMNRLGGPVPDLHEVRNVTIPLARRGGGLGLRVHRPAPGRLPVVLFLHGGWLFAGDLESHDTLARSLADAAGCVVIVLHYRRPSEWPCPDAPEDCIIAARWIAEHADDLDVDAERLALVGDGMGGMLAAITARRARDENLTLRQQILLYPVIHAGSPDAQWAVETPLANAALSELAWSMYVTTATEAAAADIAPGACTDLAGLPPALVITAEHDPLRDEAEAYAAALDQAGVPTVLHRYPGMIHGFVHLAGLVPAGREAIDEVGAALRAAFAS